MSDPTEAQRAERKRSRRLGPKLLLLAGALLFALIVCEITLRAMSETQGEYVRLRKVRLVPYPRFRGELQRILRELPRSPYIIADAELGWTIKPNGRHRNGLFKSNGAGLRSAPRELPPGRRPGIKRILLVGDSFTHGDEVTWEETWAAQLEARLGDDRFEVWNGGVPGYGTGQAVLRLERLMPVIEPDVCILGIFQEDLERNLNVFRPLLHPWTQLPFSKPRFVLDGEGLHLVNHPTVPPEAVEATIRDIENSPLRQYESYWYPPLYAESILDGLRLTSWMRSYLVQRRNYANRKALLAEGGEAAEVAGRIARRFQDRVRAAGSRPLVILLPGHKEVPSYREGRTPVLEPLRKVLRRLDVVFADLGPAFLEASRNDVGALFVEGKGHPNRKGCEVIARELARLVGEG